MLFPDSSVLADVQHLAAWLPSAQADAVMHALLTQVPWETHRIRMFGRWLDSPRLSCWMGDAEAHYRYSGADFAPHPWAPAVRELREQLQLGCDGSFNSVLLNCYRDGRDSMGWHSDDEPELGPTPLIASLSLGVSRRFLLRRRDDPAQKAEYLLGHGDLLLMRGHCQRDYQHALPKTARVSGERINLTFRQIAAVPRRAGR
ncbi:alpha-ketoglutarate-dependent dioxygenase AlkB family protein [Stenotrophomonas pigmentata]|uniref:alpha-ketoglutarate-dependent dioxygenase AlkB family protein n=1 Tax=Stenotrophomonas pigmentata TaxID=3055080 RepID=UPI0026EE9037|nr:alpha-ketoglutarate-dependent dioxygenase AlkB [Stenotrophomonas sp. 610A2]